MRKSRFIAGNWNEESKHCDWSNELGELPLGWLYHDKNKTKQERSAQGRSRKSSVERQEKHNSSSTERGKEREKQRRKEFIGAEWASSREEEKDVFAFPGGSACLRKNGSIVGKQTNFHRWRGGEVVCVEAVKEWRKDTALRSSGLDASNS
ncbi:hypothetical protein TNCV_4518681 [Trichonephila clavipes]|nr:hypothetical protein TNCV_4518681 [Trichonephila clavipes]